MGKGGARKGSGRKPKWGDEANQKIGVPASIGNDLISTIEYLWRECGLRGNELAETIRSAKVCRIQKFSNMVSAGPGVTSSVGGDSMNSFCETVDFYEALIPKPEGTYLVPVAGDSMIEIGMFQGDWLIVEKNHPLYSSPKNNDIVIVSLDDETMVKRYNEANGEITLSSENAMYEPIICRLESLYIMGVVRSWIRMPAGKRLF